MDQPLECAGSKSLTLYLSPSERAPKYLSLPLKSGPPGGSLKWVCVILLSKRQSCHHFVGISKLLRQAYDWNCGEHEVLGELLDILGIHMLEYWLGREI